MRTTKNLAKSIKKQNYLISVLFEPAEFKRSFSKGDLKPNMIIYFKNSKTTEFRGWRSSGKRQEYINVGRIIRDDNWEYFNLSPINNGIECISKRTRFPLYKVLTVKKGYTEIQKLFSNKIIRLLQKREYHAHPLKFKKRPKVKKISTQFEITQFLTKIR